MGSHQSPKRDFRTGRENGHTTVWLSGEHDFFNRAELQHALAAAVALNDADLVVDLGGVEFMSVATVTVIVRARDFLRERSRSMVLRSPSRCAWRVLELCDLAAMVEPKPVRPAA
jgi:anti-anti-sigma factor